MTTSFTWILILVGIILVLLARLFSGDVHPPLPATLLETLGVTVATVLTVHITPSGRTRALARRTPSCSRYILGIPPWA